MTNRDTIIITLGVISIMAGLAAMILWESKTGWVIAPIAFGALALICELSFYMFSLTQRNGQSAAENANENEKLP